MKKPPKKHNKKQRRAARAPTLKANSNTSFILSALFNHNRAADISNGARLTWRDAVQALVTPNTQPLWRHVWWVLAAALLLRLLAAWYGHWFWRIDEIYQYLEQAHRVVFGYGGIPWERRHDARSWLVPGMAMPPLFLAKWLGVDNPWHYATMVQMWNALLSMALPVGIYLTARRVLSDAAACWALLFTAFWYEFIILAPRTIAEIYATLFLLSGLALGAGGGRARWALAGFLLGVALAIRVHYALLIGVIGMAWLWVLPRPLAYAAVAGGSGALLLWGAIDRITLGGWWASVFNYIEYIPLLNATFKDIDPLAWGHLHYLSNTSLGLYPLIFLAAFMFIRALWFFLLLVAVLLGFHLAQTIVPEYSNIFVLLPLLWLMGGGLAAALFKKSRWLGMGGACAVLAVSVAGGMGKLPNALKIFNHSRFFSPMDLFVLTQLAHERLPEKPGTVLLWHTEWFLDWGGFYRLHRNIPVLQKSEKYVYDFNHRQLWEKNIPLHEVVSHVVARFTDFDSAEFNATPLKYGVNLYINKNTPSYPLAEEWVYDFVHPERNRILPPADLTRYNPDL